jgi:hypothetical protein
MAADGVHALVRAGRIVVTRPGKREVPLRLCCLLREQDLQWTYH